MNKASKKARQLTRSLTSLHTRDLDGVTGGGLQVGSASTGSPEAGDDTVGDDLVRPSGGGYINLTRIRPEKARRRS
jgi:hypothetical protein